MSVHVCVCVCMWVCVSRIKRARGCEAGQLLTGWCCNDCIGGIVLQVKNWKSTVILVAAPIFFCLLCFLLQLWYNVLQSREGTRRIPLFAMHTQRAHCVSSWLENSGSYSCHLRRYPAQVHRTSVQVYRLDGLWRW